MEKTKILLVDDNIAEVILAKEFCRRDRVICHIDTIRSGNDIMDYLYANGRYAGNTLPNLILIDLNMPDIDGRKLITILKKIEKIKHIPIIVYSGSQSQHDINETKALGADYYMVKPISLQKIQEMVATITSLSLIEKDHNYYIHKIISDAA